jgi:hypothetical protein
VPAPKGPARRHLHRAELTSSRTFWLMIFWVPGLSTVSSVCSPLRW